MQHGLTLSFAIGQVPCPLEHCYKSSTLPRRRTSTISLARLSRSPLFMCWSRDSILQTKLIRAPAANCKSFAPSPTRHTCAPAKPFFSSSWKRQARYHFSQSPSSIVHILFSHILQPCPFSWMRLEENDLRSLIGIPHVVKRAPYHLVSKGQGKERL